LDSNPTVSIYSHISSPAVPDVELGGLSSSSSPSKILWILTTNLHTFVTPIRPIRINTNCNPQDSEYFSTEDHLNILNSPAKPFGDILHRNPALVTTLTGSIIQRNRDTSVRRPGAPQGAHIGTPRSGSPRVHHGPFRVPNGVSKVDNDDNQCWVHP